ncbi:cellulase [Geranomyces variabilis]|nr:cellulase [Geranomyces variabilis]KAJ3141725.1 hypothetical protein HDU90_006068 [Geranomyces variabilis]
MRSTSTAIVLSALASLASTVVSAGQFKYAGVSEAGAEFAPNSLPGVLGKDYAYPTIASLDFFTKNGANLIRLPFLWERVQPRLMGHLSKAELAHIDTLVNHVTAQGKTVLLDPHNYDRYHGTVVSPAQLADFWTRMSHRFRRNPHIAFGLMNEPNSQTTESVLSNMQASINAIRATGAKNLITVPGNAWTGAHSWSETWYGSSNAAVMARITDPANNFVYEAHQYLDGDFSGQSPSCQSATVGVEQLAGMTAWARGLKRQIFLGEVAGGDNALCYQALENMFAYMRANSDVWVGFAWWGAGPLWNNYIFGVEPSANGVGTPLWNNFLKKQFANLAKREDADEHVHPTRPARLEAARRLQ